MTKKFILKLSVMFQIEFFWFIYKKKKMSKLKMLQAVVKLDC